METKQTETEKWAKNQNQANIIGGFYLLSIPIVGICSSSLLWAIGWPLLLLYELFACFF